jgi:hypothetical protein
MNERRNDRESTRAARALDVGTPVLSHYRARWAGIVIGNTENPRRTCVVVLVTIDRRGRPLRKPIRKVLNAAWLEELPC